MILAPSEPNKLQIEEDIRFYLESSLSQGTRNTYRNDLAHFSAWGGSIPSSPEQVTAYLTAYASSLSIATLQHRLVGIAKAHKLQGYVNPVKDELVHLTFRGIRRVHGKPQKQVSPVMRDDLVQMIGHIPDSIKGKRDKALLLLGFCGAFRRSELVSLKCCDLEFKTEGLVVTLTRSKTDQNAVGRQIAIPKGRGKVCPVLAVEEWLRCLTENEDCLFQSIGKGGRISGKRLSNKAVADLVKFYVQKVGLDPERYSGHSLRSGLASSAAEQGYSSWEIRRQTGHASDLMLQRYIRLGSLFQRNAAALF